MNEVFLFNTLGREKQKLTTIEPGVVKFYSCGPTVYDYVHIGNLRYFTFVDTLKRVLSYAGYSVNHVMNITDVGHLVSDEDFGQDKMLKAVEREKAKTGKTLTVWDVANYYTDAFVNDMKALHIDLPKLLTKATEHIPQMISLIEVLIQKGFAYVTPQAVYFDVTKFKDYTKLSGQKLDEKLVGTREELVLDPEKRHPADFRLWQLDQKDHAMQWDSPWGKGFPGWHIECSAMAMQYLGETLDIHTGGIDHIPVHHTNEIAQSEAATGHEFSKFWLHIDFLKVNNEKMSKSKGTGYTLTDVINHDSSAEDLRYFYLSAQYRSSLNFTWEALEGAKVSYKNMSELVKTVIAYHDLQAYLKQDATLKPEDQAKLNEYITKFNEFIFDDLNTPGALSILWEVLKSQEEFELKYQFLVKVDPIFGFDFLLNTSVYNDSSIDFSQKEALQKKIEQRWDAKLQKDWKKADEIRDEIKQRGFELIDLPNTTVIVRP